MIYLMNDYGNQFLQEAYFGYKPEFKEIEAKLKVIIDYCNNNDFGKNKAVDSLPEIKDVERLITKAFGYKDMSLFIDELVIKMDYNAYTYPNGFKYLDLNQLKRMNFSNVFTVEANNAALYPGVTVSANLIKWSGMNEKELFAIILHELGHVSQITIIDFLNMVFIMTILGFFASKGYYISEFIEALIYQIPGTNAIVDKYWFKPLNDFFMRLPLISDIIKIGNAFTTSVQVLFGSAINFLVLFAIAKGNYNILGQLANNIGPQWIMGYGVEKTADSYPTKFGYGAHLASALNKMEYMKKNPAIKALDDSLIGRIFSDYIMGINTIFLQTFDVHPSNLSRTVSQLENLKRELNRPDVPPKIKAQINSNIKEMEGVLNSKYLEPNYEDKEMGGRALKATYNLFMYRAFGGKTDLRDLIFSGTNTAL